MKQINWGIIGCGKVTELKSGPAFNKIENSRLVAVMRRNAELAEDYAKRHHVPKWYDDAEQLVSDPEVNAIYIATPPAFHKEYTLLAAKYKKPVYVEKPMALNYQECLEMIEACKEAKVPLYVAYYRRALPKFLKIKELIENGAIGAPRFVKTVQYKKALDKNQDLPWRVDPAIAGGGLYFDLACHTLDILAYILGPITDVHGFASNQDQAYKAEDIVSGTYKFESGVHGIGMWCFSSFKYEDLNEIVGSKGKIVFSTFGHDIELITETTNEKMDCEAPLHIQQPLITTIVEELTGLGTCPSTGLTGSNTNWVMDEMVKEYYSKI
jgi:predicted dehydrogenase